MGLLTEIQNGAIDEASSVAGLLRKCLLLAARLESNPLEDWVKQELDGYGSEVAVPDYRNLHVNYKGNFVASFGRQANNVPVHPAVIEAVTKGRRSSRFQARQAITTIDTSQATRDAGVLMVSCDELTPFLSNKVFEDYQCLQLWGEIPAMGVVGIVEAVKTRVLELALSIEKKYPEAGEVGDKTVNEEDAKKDVAGLLQTIVYGNVGVLGTANHSTVNIVVNPGNFDQLSSTLLKSGLSEADVQELKVILKDEPAIAGPKAFGPKLKKWIGKMVGKAVADTWQVGVGAGAALLEAALLGYYGLN
jgi:hypothetical protein